MRPFRQLVYLLLCPLLSMPLIGGIAAAAQQEVPLSTVASQAHLQYSWLGASRAVQLRGPGLIVVIRPGESLYEINNRVESTDIPPSSVGNDVYVSSSLAHHIMQIAWHMQAMDANVRRAEEQAVARSFALQGAIALNVQPLKGQEAVLITGTAPPGAPVLITLLATFAAELPNVLISRHDLTAGADGKFQAVLPIGPDYLQDSFLRILATSGPNVTSASAQILLGPPNPGANVPIDAWSGSVW
jgi:hypothetical protein